MTEKQDKAVTADATVRTVDFKLSVLHTHAGEKKQPDDVITLREDQAKRMAKAGRGAVV